MTKISVNLSEEDVKVLKELAKKRSITMTAVLRRAIGTEKFLDEVKEEGGKVFVKYKSGKTTRLVFQ